MTKPARQIYGAYFWAALYLGSRLKTGDLLIRFGVVVVLFVIVPVAFYAFATRLKTASRQ